MSVGFGQLFTVSGLLQPAAQVRLTTRLHVALPSGEMKVTVWLPVALNAAVWLVSVSTLPQLSVADTPNCAAVTVTLAGQLALGSTKGVLLPQLLSCEKVPVVGVQEVGPNTVIICVQVLVLP